jgi:hypothetical protein
VLEPRSIEPEELRLGVVVQEEPGQAEVLTEQRLHPTRVVIVEGLDVTLVTDNDAVSEQPRYDLLESFEL